MNYNVFDGKNGDTQQNKQTNKQIINKCTNV